jgi:hypothetical protein
MLLVLRFTLQFAARDVLKEGQASIERQNVTVESGHRASGGEASFGKGYGRPCAREEVRYPVGCN